VAARPDVEPGKRARAAAAAREAAQSELLSRLPRARRPVARFLFKQTARQVRNLELGKATYHIALDGCRSAARRLGSDLAARGLLEDPEDVFFLTVAELADPPPGVRELVEFRRARRAEYQAVELPMTFTGVPQPRDAAVFDPSIRQVTGIGGGAGIVEGRARVAAEIEDEDCSNPATSWFAGPPIPAGHRSSPWSMRS
jgi:pyruvate,water dikinase